MSKRTKTRNGSSGPAKAPSWHELVQPGPKGDPNKKAARAAARHVGTVEKPFHGANRATRRAVQGGSANTGRLVTHSRKPLPAGHPARNMPRPDVMRRRLIRDLRARNVEFIDGAKAAA